MVEIKGGNAKKKISEEFYISEAEAAPVVANVIAPVFEVDKNVVNVVRATGSNTVIYTTPTTEDFYLTAISVSAEANSKAASSNTSVTVILKDGTTQYLGRILFTTTATSYENRQIHHTFPVPILLKRGTQVTSFSSNMDTNWYVIYGYTKPSYSKV